MNSITFLLQDESKYPRNFKASPLELVIALDLSRFLHSLSIFSDFLIFYPIFHMNAEKQ